MREAKKKDDVFGSFTKFYVFEGRGFNFCSCRGHLDENSKSLRSLMGNQRDFFFLNLGESIPGENRTYTEMWVRVRVCEGYVFPHIFRISIQGAPDTRQNRKICQTPRNTG